MSLISNSCAFDWAHPSTTTAFTASFSQESIVQWSGFEQEDARSNRRASAKGSRADTSGADKATRTNTNTTADGRRGSAIASGQKKKNVTGQYDRAQKVETTKLAEGESRALANKGKDETESSVKIRTKELNDSIEGMETDSCEYANIVCTGDAVKLLGKCDVNAKSKFDSGDCKKDDSGSSDSGAAADSVCDLFAEGRRRTTGIGMCIKAISGYTNEKGKENYQLGSLALTADVKEEYKRWKEFVEPLKVDAKKGARMNRDGLSIVGKLGQSLRPGGNTVDCDDACKTDLESKTPGELGDCQRACASDIAQARCKPPTTGLKLTVDQCIAAAKAVQ